MDPFQSASPFPGAGLPENLRPNPPSFIPEAPEAGDATPKSPFIEAQDVDAIIAQLVLDRPLKLFIPDRDKYPEYEFRIINEIPQEIADAHNKGWKRITAPEMVELFQDLVAGTDKMGKAYRPVLMARHKKIGEHIRKRHRGALRSLYAGMDPRNKDLNGKYTENVRDGKDSSKGMFTGDGWRIRV
jgi:hypothetical protein